MIIKEAASIMARGTISELINISDVMMSSKGRDKVFALA
jgi:hypothetical protein